MNYWHLCFQLVLPLLFAPEPWAKDTKDPYMIDLEEFNMTVRGHQQVITVTWNIPNKAPPQCYKSEVEYKNQCVQDWRSLEVSTTYSRMNECNFTYLSMKQNYDFRLRIKPDCIDGDWSNWTRVQSWGNNKGACKVDSFSNMWIYILIIVLPMIGLLLICLMMQKGIRKLILPVVPDPKNYKNKIMDIDQSQWWSSLGQSSEECKATEIEIVSQSENSEDDHTVVIQSMDTMYCMYSSETPAESPEAPCCQVAVGYITL